MPAPISIAITNSIIREGLRHIFTDAGFDVAESVGDLDDLDLDAHAGQELHLLVIERDLLQEQSVDMLETIYRDRTNLRVVVLTGNFDFDEMIALYAAGAYAYFPDQVPYLSLVAILQMVTNGQKVAPPEVIDFLVNLPVASRRSAAAPELDAYGFRDRELRVLEQLALGQPNKAIAREMTVNEAAVKAAVKAILRKLGVDNRTQAAVLARELLAPHNAADDVPPASAPGLPIGPADSTRAGNGHRSYPESAIAEHAKSYANIRNNSLQKLINRTSIWFCYIQALQMACLS